MKVTIVHDAKIPVTHYGGIERVIWYLGKGLAALGHEVTYVVPLGSVCPFARVLPYDAALPIEPQVPPDSDIVHVHFFPNATLSKPFLMTVHGISDRFDLDFPINTVFISQQQAAANGAQAVVYHGLDWDDYGKNPALDNPRRYVHFLAKAAWRLKNVRGAIGIARKAREKLYVMGGNRLNFKMGFRLTLDPNVRFFGMVGGAQKNALLASSKALIFPVRGHEAFGLALIESLYFGCPVLGTPYGSLPELITADYGTLSTRADDLAYALRHIDDFDRVKCHQYATEQFDHLTMAKNYLHYYEKIANGENINTQKPRLQTLPTEKYLPFEY
jgi:glycosyltransferase involved in cell wall biosynthesis